ncbi:hypothetical protein C8Q78DRAFT_1048058 [Trametes maxima]|nr:hypothetical protein C8Q78DRAFT_1048058 [Trametes maxima]
MASPSRWQPEAIPRAAPRLAGELTDRIIDFLHDDWRTLASCAATGLDSVLVPCVEYHLSHTIDLPISGGHTEILDFMKVFKPVSSIAQVVRSIHIHGPRGVVDRPAATLPILLDLSHLPNLRDVALSHLFVESNARFARFLCRLPALEELSCDGLVMKPSNPWGRPIRDVGPMPEDVAALGRRLSILRIVDRTVADELPLRAESPYDRLFSILYQGHASPHTLVFDSRDSLVKTALRQLFSQTHSRLRHLDTTIHLPLGLSKRHPGYEEIWDPHSIEFLDDASHWTFLRTLRILYSPWRARALPANTSRVVDPLLELLSELFVQLAHNTPGENDWHPKLESFELVLPLPSDAQPNLSVLDELAESLSTSCWPGLQRIRVFLGLLHKPIGPDEAAIDMTRLEIMEE